jgi:hypothetical protein
MKVNEVEKWREIGAKMASLLGLSSFPVGVRLLQSALRTVFGSNQGFRRLPCFTQLL